MNVHTTVTSVSLGQERQQESLGKQIVDRINTAVVSEAPANELDVVNLSNPQQQSTSTQSVLTEQQVDRPSQHVVFGSAIGTGAGESGSSAPGYFAAQHGAIGRNDDKVWEHSCRQKVQSHVGSRAEVDHVVSPTLPRLGEDRAQVGETLCGAQSGGGRTLEPQDPRADLSERSPEPQPQSQEVRLCQGQGKESIPTTQDWQGRHGCRDPGEDCSMGSSGSFGHRGGAGLGCAVGTSERWRADTSGLPRGRRTELADTIASYGDHVATSCKPHPSKCQQVDRELKESWEALIAAGDVDAEADELRNPDRKPQQSAMHRRFQQLVQQISHELEIIQSQSNRSSTSKADLFEVFCGNQSRLTHQVQHLQGKAVRFSKDRTDLMTSEGRQVLFVELCSLNPSHVWFAPECGPWSSWSNLNQMKSIELWDKIQHARYLNLEQLALGVVLLRYQRSQGRHFHWEQPGRSNMFRTPLLQEVYVKTMAAEFDMCNLGELTDPTTGKLIKKAMTVLSTSENLQKALHGHHCRKNHDHQAIEGTTKYKGVTMSRSAFTENYPRKFARYVARVLLKRSVPAEKPIGWNVCEALVTTSGENALKRRRLSSVSTVRSKAVKHPVDESESSRPKRFRMLTKGPAEETPDNIADQWREVLENLAPKLPRVGRSEITCPETIQRIQKLIGTQNEIKTIVGGKGMNRTTAPLRRFETGEAPWRKLVFIHRNTGKIHGIDHWEKWEDLPKRKIVRTGYPSRVAITIFTGNPSSSTALEQLSQFRSAEGVADTELGPGKSREHPENAQFVPEMENDVDVDVTSDQQGVLFKSLSKEDQALLMKIHKNAGHPGPDKLQYLLKQQGFRPELIAAASDLQCSACQMMGRPKISRPAAIHTPCDFNDIISMDGYSWKNSQGTSYHFYHLVDHSTSFQVARYAPNRSVENAIDAIIQSWFSWAGSPNEMLIDAATELNAEQFSVFMQQCNVKCTTISTDAHWQNGKAERHGQILADMLSKYDLEHPIGDAHDLQVALAHCTQAKNALSIRRGFAPEVLVLGKQTRLPGSVCSDSQLPAHALADAEHCHGLVFRQHLARREAARRAYHMADNDAVLRRAILRRTRPARQWYRPGEWVMVWKSGLNEGWRGPMKVVIHENAQTVWITQNGKLYRHAPEHIRPVTALESRDIPSTEVFQPLPRIGGVEENRVEPRDRMDTQDNIPSTSNGLNQDNLPEPEVQAPSEGEPSSEPHPGISTTGSEEGNPDTPNIDAAEVPVPEEIHDELVGWHCNDDDHIENVSLQKAWVGEIVIQENDIANWKKEEQPTEMAFLVSAAKRQKSEVRLRDLDPKEVEMFRKAKQGEINNWLSTGTVKRIFRNQIPEDQILRCRWLLTWKNVEQPAPGEPDQKAKARLIVLGYLDPQLEEIPRDSPTMSKTSRMLILQMIASEGWDLMSFDVKAAFLQGNQSGRTLGLEPVPELVDAMKLKSNEICQLVKGAYGLVDAPYLWYKTLQAELIRLGFRTTPFDPCTFVLYDSQGIKPQGILGIHVDDGLCGGNETFLEKLRQLETKYPFGAKKMGSFTFTGIDLHQNPDKSIVLSQSKYVRNIKPISIDPKRKDQIEQAVTEDERQMLRGLIGSLQYASVHTRPDLSSRLSYLQSKINSATVDTLQTGNKVLHEAKRHHDVTIKIQPISSSDVRFLAFTDASFASKKCPDSQAGSIILATHRNIEKNISCPVSPISWGSKKIQKVVTSTLAAETMSLSSNLDQLSWIRLYWGWLYKPTDGWKHPADTLLQLPSAVATATFRVQQMQPDSVAATDCKSLYDLVTRTAPPNCQEFRTQLQTRAIKEQLAEGVALRWVHSGAQLADSLTKIMENNFLRETLRIGRYKLNDELEVLKDRASSRNRIKWLKSNEAMSEEEINAMILEIL